MGGEGQRSDRLFRIHGSAVNLRTRYGACDVTELPLEELLHSTVLLLSFVHMETTDLAFSTANKQ